MANFVYKAKSSTGQTVSGVLTAESQQAALRMLDDRALFPIKVTEKSLTSRTVITGRTKKIKLRVISSFYSQFSDLLRAGVPALRSIDVLARSCSNPLLVEVLKTVHGDVSGGATLADAMAKHPNAFNDLAVAMIRAGEQGGFLEDVLSRVSIFTERQDELRNKLVGSMVYPCILLLAGVTVVSFLMVYVVPKIRPLLQGVEKPWVTTVLFAVCDFIHPDVAGLYVLLFLGGVFAFLLFLCKHPQGRLHLDKLKLRMPIMGPIVTMVAVCRFCRILGTMIHNGVPILQSLRVSKDSAGNQILADQIERASESVQKGESLAGPLAASGLFPLDVVDMIAVAEESNNLENVLIQVADSNEARTGRQIDLAVKLLEPLMLMVMAVIVLVIAVALLVPILRMSSAIAV